MPDRKKSTHDRDDAAHRATSKRNPSSTTETPDPDIDDMDMEDRSTRRAQSDRDEVPSRATPRKKK